MSILLIEDEIFDKKDFSINRLPNADYEYCTFKNCNFSEGFLSKIRFLECEFIDCNLSSANITGASFQDVKFIGCKILGVHFENCNPFGFALHIEDCQLNHASFYQVVLSNTRIINSKLQNVEFTEADLSRCVFDGCDFQGATFDNTNLEKADFRKAINYNIHPDRNRLKGAKFSLGGVVGLLGGYGVEIE
ncbi:pentapeptide repeat-containing protein [Thalassobellus citreus]|uniref:pentapeptide repeat-containing protein n=1 Tax=Thalassobellus citreus TaxID=3367752 RepID=UPI003787DAB0